jgi:type IV pilus assembly protein PilF
MMRKTNILLTVVIACFLSACISTETGTRRTADTDEDAAQQLFNLGTQYYKNGKWALARDRLERATKLDPRNAGAFSMLALSYVELDNERLATESFEQAVQIEPKNFNVRNRYAIFLCAQNNFIEAQKHFDSAIDVHENDNAEIMMSNAGVCMAKKPDYVLAEQYFRDALTTRPTYGEPLIQLAALKHNTDDDLTARAFMQRYLSVNEASAAVLYLGVQIETSLGDDRAATDYGNQILRDFPESPEADQLMRSGMTQN